jgi:hypothetical protein
VIDVGSAGAMVWSVNGKNARPLGSLGQPWHARITPATVGNFVK